MGVTNKRTITKTRRKTRCAVQFLLSQTRRKKHMARLMKICRDVDQIKADLLSSKHLAQYKDSKAAEDLPGLGRHYCIECAKWFDTEFTLVAHRRGKPHKRRYVCLVVVVVWRRAAPDVILTVHQKSEADT
jgi:bud site selection protein 20